MPDENLPIAATFDVRRRAYIGLDGAALTELPDFASDRDLLVSLYRGMVQARTFDLKAVALQRTGRLGTYATSLGQEAVAVGMASAMQPDDVLLPSYRDNAALLWRGVSMEDILLFWGGDERGNRWSGPAHDFPFCIPVGSQAPHAAGVAYAFKYRKQARVAVCSASGTEMAHWLLLTTNTTGSFQTPAKFIASQTSPFEVAPSPKMQTATRACLRYLNA